MTADQQKELVLCCLCCERDDHDDCAASVWLVDIPDIPHPTAFISDSRYTDFDLHIHILDIHMHI